MTPHRPSNLSKDTWGGRLASRRTDLGLTQEALAAICRPYISQQTISKIERGVIVPRLTTLERLARALGTSVDELFPWSARPHVQTLAS